MNDPWPSPGNMDLRMFLTSLIDWWFCGVHLEQWTMLYQFVRAALHKYQDWRHTPGFITGVLSFSCFNWLPAGCACENNPPQKPQILTLRWVSLGRRERFGTCPCCLLPERKHIVCSPGRDLCQTSLDSLMCTFSLLLLFCILYCNKL